MIVAMTFVAALAGASKEPDGWRQDMEGFVKEGCVSSLTAGKSLSVDAISTIAHYCDCTSATYANTITYDELLASVKSKSWQDMPKLDNRLRVAAEMKCAAEIKAFEALGIKQ